MASAAPRKNNVKKTFSLEEMVHGVLEKDDDESSSEFIGSESEIGDYEHEDGNQLFFVPAITNVQLSSFPDPVDRVVVFQDEEDILHVHGSIVSTFSEEFIWNCSTQFIYVLSVFSFFIF